MIILILILTALASVLVLKLFINFSSMHIRYTVDEVSGGPQKNHEHTVSRIGGVGIFMGYLFGIAMLDRQDILLFKESLPLLLFSLPIFLAGLSEDIVKNIKPAIRLWASFFSIALVFFFLDAQIRRLGIPFIDNYLWFTPLAFIISIVMQAGVVHAFNIIDGLNGLLGAVGVIVTTGLACVAFFVGDHYVFALCLILISTLLGFLYWNYPSGKIFSGDGGAYFVGFLVAVFSVLLVSRNAEVSPWFPLLNCIYPVYETIFTIYRRRMFSRFEGSASPDHLHLHQLIYQRVSCRVKNNRLWCDRAARNARSSLYLWVYSSIFSFLGVAFFDNTLVIMLLVLLYVYIYGSLYRRIVQFKFPKWLHIF